MATATVTVKDRSYTFKDDYTMNEVEKIQEVTVKSEKWEVTQLEVVYTSIFHLISEIVDENGEQVNLNYNQIRESFRKMTSTEFAQLANMMKNIKEGEDDKKKPDSES